MERKKDLERKAYFQNLYELFKKINWDQFKEHEKVNILRNWFIAVSNEYSEAFLIYHILKKRYIASTYKRPTIWSDEKERRFLASNKKALLASTLASKWGLPIDEYNRNYELTYGGIAFKPARIFSVEDAQQELRALLSLGNPEDIRGYNTTKVLLVNTEYPFEELTEEIKKLIEHEQNYKKDTKGRRVSRGSVRLDKLIKCLHVYILRQCNWSFQKIGETLSESANPAPQMKQYENSAEKLIIKALQGNFPGEYS